MPAITLPDGSTREFKQPVTVMQIAEDIGPGLAKATLAGRVNGRLVDACVLGNPREEYTDKLNRIALRCASLPRRDNKSLDEIIGYDERGLPR